MVGGLRLATHGWSAAARSGTCSPLRPPLWRQRAERASPAHPQARNRRTGHPSRRTHLRAPRAPTWDRPNALASRTVEEVERQAERVLERVPSWIWDGESLPVPVEDIANT